MKSVILSTEDLVQSNVLVSPDTHQPLKLSLSTEELNNTKETFPIVDSVPDLRPARIREAEKSGELFRNHVEPLLQYEFLQRVKNQEGGENNSQFLDPATQLHSSRLFEFTKDLVGRILDVGCGDPENSSQLFGTGVEYVGVDPFSLSTFSIRAMAEFLPFADNSFDAVVFNTSLDHILDFRTAIEEASRVVRKGGVIVVASLVWVSDATLLRDNVHFHHFRESDLTMAFQHMTVIEKRIFPDPKDLPNRRGFYLVVRAD